MDRIADLVRQLEPETPSPSREVRARQRDALLESMAQVERAPKLPIRRHARPTGRFVAVAGAAVAAVAGVVAVVAAFVVPGSSEPSRPSAPTSAVLTAVTKALATTGGDIEEIRSTVAGAPVSTNSWIDLSSGTCRTDTSFNGHPSLTISLENGKALTVDYGRREWWTRDNAGASCAPPLTPQTIEHDVRTGSFTVAGHAVVGGQPSLKLVFMSTTTGPHRVTELTTLWVNATTYLPIQSTSANHLSERTTFTWLPATAVNAAMLHVSIPAGFRQVAPPPPGVQAGG